MRSRAIKYCFLDAYKGYFAGKYLAGMLFSMELQKCSNSCSGETFRNAPNGRRQVDSTDLADPGFGFTTGPFKDAWLSQTDGFLAWIQARSERSSRPTGSAVRRLVAVDCATPNFGHSYMGKIIAHRGLPEC